MQTPISDANGTALDAMHDALKDVDAPDRIDKIWQAYYAGYEALANAVMANQGSLADLLNRRFDRLESTSQHRSEQMTTLDADIKLTLNRMHQMASMVQGLIVKIDDQSLYASLLDERLTLVENETTAIKADLAIIKEKLGL